jgi:hypothetical protein
LIITLPDSVEVWKLLLNCWFELLDETPVEGKTIEFENDLKILKDMLDDF